MFAEVRSRPTFTNYRGHPCNEMKCPMDRLVYWIHERELIRRKRARGLRPPWTNDPILDTFKFCNVQRENDRVTRWIKDNWRDPHYTDPNMWFTMGVARLINWPETLNAIHYPYPWFKDQTRRRMQARKDKKQQVFTGAYMITNAGKKLSKIDAVVLMLDNLHKLKDPPIKGDTLARAHAKLMSGNATGMGSFMAAQVIADCKHTDLLAGARDWWEWCAPGPGSTRGLSRLLGTDPHKWRQDIFIEKLAQLRTEIAHTLDMELCLQDLQNCLCEFDKFERTLWGEGRPRSRYVPNTQLEL